jgi:DNA-binding transcriptional regulator YiaG
MGSSARKRKKGVQWDADRVRALRSRLKMTQEEFAEELGVRQQTVSEWEVARHKARGASTTVLNMIAERCGFRYRARRPERPSGGSAEGVG